MIYDNISNIDKYNIPDKVKDFIKQINKNIEPGRYVIDDNSFANVDEYNTRPAEICGLEAHKKYIDIQILLSGKEQLDFTYTKKLQIKDKYDENRDVMFFHVPDNPLNSVYLEEGKFTLLYPYEAHRPQMNYNNNSLKVKKAVVKIKVD